MSPNPLSNMVFVDPRTFTEADLPIIVLSDDLRGFIGWAIKFHTSGNYNHAFIMHKPGMMVSQDFGGFRERSIDRYLVPTQMLKFWRIKDLNPNEKAIIQAAITQRLALPPWRRAYDFLGTFVGQFLRIKWIQSPWQEYCSEQVNDDYISHIPRVARMGIKEPFPSELDSVFRNYPEEMEVVGYRWGG